LTDAEETKLLQYIEEWSEERDNFVLISGGSGGITINPNLPRVAIQTRTRKLLGMDASSGAIGTDGTAYGSATSSGSSSVCVTYDF
jgi:hypothetical protein